MFDFCSLYTGASLDGAVKLNHEVFFNCVCICLTWTHCFFSYGNCCLCCNDLLEAIYSDLACTWGQRNKEKEQRRKEIG